MIKNSRSLKYKSAPQTTGIALSIFHFAFLGLLVGCQVGGSAAFEPGVSVAENNSLYTGEPVTGDWVTTNMLDEPETLNPQTSSSASATYIKSYIYEALIQTRREPPWDDIPLLADGMPEISEDHLRYHWKIRREARWHDGKQLTARDVEFTLKSLINPYVDNLPSKPYYAELDSVVVRNDYELVMYCSKPYFMHLQFLGGNYIMPKHIFDADGLLDDLSYWQVKNGSGFGRVADFLESGVNEANAPVFAYYVGAGAAMTALRKSLETVTEGKVKWNEFEKFKQDKHPPPPNGAVVDAEVFTFLDEYQDAVEFLSARGADAAPALRLIQEAYRSAEFAWRSEVGAEAASTLQEAKRLAVRFRDIADRIQKYGLQFNSHPAGREPRVGSGPYQFERWVVGQEIVLKRNEDYWQGEGHAFLDRIVWRVLTDYTASLVALKNGEIDFMENLQSIQFLTMTNRKKFLDKFVKSTFLIPTYSYIGWQNSNPIFADKRVRQAMSHLVRKHEIAEKIQFGFSVVVESPFYLYGYDFDSTLKSYTFDPIRAQELLREAGWEDVDNDGILENGDREFRFELILPSGSPLGDQVASILREDLAVVGIDMSVRRLEWSVFINNYIRNHKFDACFLSWVMGLQQDPKQIFHSESAKGRGSNHVEFRNARADSVIEAARTEFDRDMRREYYQEFQRIVNEEQPYTFMFSTKFKPAYDRRFKGVKWYPFRPGYQLDEWFVPIAEQKHNRD